MTVALATQQQTWTIPAAALRDDDRTLVALLVENEGPDGMKEAAIMQRFDEAARRRAGLPERRVS